MVETISFIETWLNHFSLLGNVQDNSSRKISLSAMLDETVVLERSESNGWDEFTLLKKSFETESRQHRYQNVRPPDKESPYNYFQSITDNPSTLSQWKPLPSIIKIYQPRRNKPTCKHEKIIYQVYLSINKK